MDGGWAVNLLAIGGLGVVVPWRDCSKAGSRKMVMDALIERLTDYIFFLCNAIVGISAITAYYATRLKSLQWIATSCLIAAPFTFLKYYEFGPEDYSTYWYINMAAITVGNVVWAVGAFVLIKQVRLLLEVSDADATSDEFMQNDAGLIGDEGADSDSDCKDSAEPEKPLP